MGWLLGSIMRRYWIEKKDIFQDQVNFSGDVFHHVFDVCRQEIGSKFEVLTEDSKAYFVEVIYVTKKTALARILEERLYPSTQRTTHPLSSFTFTFSGDGCHHGKSGGTRRAKHSALFSEFSFLRKGEKLSDNKMERWEKIVRSATQQSGRGDLMQIHSPISFDKITEAINQTPQSMGLFAYEGPSTLGIKDYVTQMKAKNIQGIRNIWIIVGSEGGFSHKEVRRVSKTSPSSSDLRPAGFAS